MGQSKHHSNSPPHFSFSSLPYILTTSSSSLFRPFCLSVNPSHLPVSTYLISPILFSSLSSHSSPYPSPSPCTADHHTLYGVLHGPQEVHQEGATHRGLFRMAYALRVGLPQSYDGEGPSHCSARSHSVLDTALSYAIHS
jgi:hypothetical protein